jgi:glutathione S-transferase
MTSDGHALTRLRRYLERGNATQIRAIVAELPRPPGLEDALAICLALLEREPQTYPRAAAKSASRFAIERRLTLTDAQLTLAALAALPGESARAGAEALIELAERYRLERIDELLTEWSERRGVCAKAQTD